MHSPLPFPPQGCLLGSQPGLRAAGLTGLEHSGPREDETSADYPSSSQSSHPLSDSQGKAECQSPLFGPDLGLMPSFFQCCFRIQPSIAGNFLL